MTDAADDALRKRVLWLERMMLAIVALFPVTGFALTFFMPMWDVTDIKNRAVYIFGDRDYSPVVTVAIVVAIVTCVAYAGVVLAQHDHRMIPRGLSLSALMLCWLSVALAWLLAMTTRADDYRHNDNFVTPGTWMYSGAALAFTFFVAVVESHRNL